MAKTVGIVGTMDTKGIEFAFIKTQIESAGVSTCVINTGILGEPQLTPDISADEVAQAGGSSLQALRDEGDRGNSVTIMAQGAAALVAQKHAAGDIDGIISLGWFRRHYHRDNSDAGGARRRSETHGVYVGIR